MTTSPASTWIGGVFRAGAFDPWGLTRLHKCAQLINDHSPTFLQT